MVNEKKKITCPHCGKKLTVTVVYEENAGKIVIFQGEEALTFGSQEEENIDEAVKKLAEEWVKKAEADMEYEWFMKEWEKTREKLKKKRKEEETNEGESRGC